MHATVRSLVEVASQAAGDICVLDIEASLEHFSQNKALHADLMLIVVEPYYTSLETGRRMARLGKQLEPQRLAVVANKVREERELDAVRDLAASEGVEMAGAVPYDERLVEADWAATAPLDFDPGAPAVAAIDRLARRLVPDDGRGRGDDGMQLPAAPGADAAA